MTGGRTAVITGASRGIGRATAGRLAKAGFDMFLVADGSEAELAAVAEECRKEGGTSAYALLDLSDHEACLTLAARAADAFGRVDVLVNNAAIRVRRPFGEYTRHEFDLMVAVNLRAPFLASQAVLPLMRKSGGGRIIHVASQIGTVAYEQSALYGLTKAALIYLGRAMAYELANEGIIVNVVSPGPVETEYNIARMRADPGFRDRRTADVPAGRWGRPEEIAEAVEFLATSEATFIHGHNLVVDGGYLTR